MFDADVAFQQLNDGDFACGIINAVVELLLDFLHRQLILHTKIARQGEAATFPAYEAIVDGAIFCTAEFK